MKPVLCFAVLSMVIASAGAQVPGAKPFPPAKPYCAECGTVRTVDIINRSDHHGLIIGNVLGPKAVKVTAVPSTLFRIVIDMDDGKTREINVPDAAGLEMGIKVRVINGDIEKRG